MKEGHQSLPRLPLSPWPVNTPYLLLPVIKPGAGRQHGTSWRHDIMTSWHGTSWRVSDHVTWHHRISVHHQARAITVFSQFDIQITDSGPEHCPAMRYSDGRPGSESAVITVRLHYRDLSSPIISHHPDLIPHQPSHFKQIKWLQIVWWCTRDDVHVVRPGTRH